MCDNLVSGIMMKYHYNKKLGRQRIYFISQFQVTLYHSGVSQQQELEVAGFVTPIDKGRKAFSLLHSCFVFSLTSPLLHHHNPLPRGRCGLGSHNSAIQCRQSVMEILFPSHSMLC